MSIKYKKSFTAKVKDTKLNIQGKIRGKTISRKIFTKLLGSREFVKIKSIDLSEDNICKKATEKKQEISKELSEIEEKLQKRFEQYESVKDIVKSSQTYELKNSKITEVDKWAPLKDFTV